MPIYRDIYKEHFGDIPIDQDGRTYDIHHIDGNHANNHPDNLKAVSIQDHYNIHFAQEDWWACLRIAARMNLSREELSEHGRKNMQKMIDEGRHPMTSELARERELKKVAEGNHRFLNSDFQRASAKKRVDKGTHPFLGSGLNKRLIAQGKHHSQIEHTCPICGESGKGNFFKGRHFSKCINMIVESG